MALKINTPIGTNKGITSEAYVRISNYSFYKPEIAVFQMQLFLNEEESKNSQISFPFPNSTNLEIGNEVRISVDLASLKDQDIFVFGYGEVKKHLATLFGEENIEDC